MSDHVGQEFAAVAVKDQNGATRRLDEAWAEKPAVLVFVRHFG